MTSKVVGQNLLSAVLDYAARGIPVFPCDANKKPYIKGGFHSASADAEQIKRWWTKWPDAWIGMPTGEASGIDVLDLDRKKGKDGFASVPEWETLSAVIVRTPSGGVHIYFKASGTSTTRDTIALGVDTRGDGGYVVVPPSPGYQWVNGQDFNALRPFPKRLIPPKPSRKEPAMPAWMEQWCKDNPDEMRANQRMLAALLDDLSKVTTDEVKAALAVIPANCSEEVWWKVAAALHDELGDEGFTFFHDWSATGGASYKGERDCRTKWRHSANKTDIHIGTIFYYADEHDPSWRQRIEAKTEAPTIKPEEPTAPEAAEAPLVSPIELFWPGETPDQKPDWLIKNRMPKVGVGLLSARRSRGKTFVALDLSYALTSKTHWTGQRITEPVAVLWIAAEAPSQIPIRLHGLPQEPGQWPFVYIKKCPKLLTSKGQSKDAVDELIKVWRAANQQMEDRFGMRIGAILIDTMLRVAGYSGGGGENDPTQGGAVMTALTEISVATETFVLGIDHMGKDESRGTRGNTAKEDGSDLVMYISDGGTLDIEKVRNGPDGLSIPFELKEVVLGTDRDGDPVTTCKVDWGEPEQTMPREVRRQTSADKMFQAAIDKVTLPATVDALREAHKTVYAEAKKTGGHERKEWNFHIKSQTLTLYDEGGVQMVRRRF